jgi:peptidoglycan LD-endopeptidase CwlK
MNYTSKEIFDFMRKTSLTQGQVDSFYKLLEEGAELNTIASFLGIQETEQEIKVSKFKLSERSLKSLEGVNPNLVKVVERAIELTEQDFLVLEGVRSKEQCYINYGKGRTVAQCSAKGVPTKYAQPNLSKVTWLNNPLASKHVTGNAVDLVPSPVDWNTISKFTTISKAMKQAAKELGVDLEWGGDWTKKDYPHFEL